MNKSFDEVKVEEYAGLYLPGGRASEYLRCNKKVIKMVEYFLKNKKPICAVCHALLLLAQNPAINKLKIKILLASLCQNYLLPNFHIIYLII